ncbi:MAG TPA: CoA transferase [Caulobacteraceae bacterium]|nr:CoA transferase [Caulobacteraceae bacterium]
MTQTSSPAPGPLAGIRVVDLTQFILGPYATQTLGDLGADVIKVEAPEGDRQRRMGKAPKSDNMGPVFVSLNRNKRSVVLDLTADKGRAALRALIATADMFIHNMRPEAIARLGFSYADVAAVKPDIVYVEAMGYAPEGPYAGRQAFDDLIQAASGACGLAAMGDAAAPFKPLPAYVADKTSGLFAAIASLAALRHKERTGEGQYVCVPMLEAFTGYMMVEHLHGETYVPANSHFGSTMATTPYRRPLATKDGHIAVAPASREQTARFFALGGIPDAYESERFKRHQTSDGRVAEYNAMMADAAASRTTAEWLDLCERHHIPAMRANEPEEILKDPQLTQTLFEVRELEADGRYRAMRPPLRFSKSPAAIRRDPPRLGRHTDEVLAELGLRTAPAAAAE